MYEFHGWFGLAESPEEGDTGNLEARIAGLRARVERIEWATGDLSLHVHNGQYFLLAVGLVNRRRDEAEELHAVLRYVAAQLPGSYGLLYERSADMEETPGQGGFRVHVLARGELHVRLDPFLSPVNPVIEE